MKLEKYIFKRALPFALALTTLITASTGCSNKKQEKENKSEVDYSDSFARKEETIIEEYERKPECDKSKNLKEYKKVNIDERPSSLEVKNDNQDTQDQTANLDEIFVLCFTDYESGEEHKYLVKPEYSNIGKSQDKFETSVDGRMEDIDYDIIYETNLYRFVLNKDNYCFSDTILYSNEEKQYFGDIFTLSLNIDGIYYLMYRHSFDAAENSFNDADNIIYDETQEQTLLRNKDKELSIFNVSITPLSVEYKYSELIVPSSSLSAIETELNNNLTKNLTKQSLN